MTALNYTIYTLELSKNLLSFILNSFVLYITVHKFKLKGVDICLSFMLCSADVLFCLHNSIHIILHAITNSKINQDPIYNKTYFGIYWVLISASFICLVTLEIVRYMAICKDYLIRRRSGILLVLAFSLVPVVLSIIIPIVATSKDNSNTWGNIYPTLNLTDNNLTKPMGIFINFSPYIYLAVLVFCYFNIILYYYKSLRLLQLQTYSSGKSTNLADYFNNGSKTTKIAQSCGRNDRKFLNESNTAIKVIKSQKQKTYVKYSLVLIVFICEILPMSLIHTISYFHQAPSLTLWDTVCTYLFNFFTLSDPCFILFFHFETYQEFKMLMVDIGAKFKK